MQRRVGYVLGAVGLAGGAVAVGYFLWNRDRFLTWQSTDRTLSGQKGATDYVQRQIANNQLASSIHDASVVDVAIGVSAGALLAAGIALVALAPRAEAAAPPPAATPPAPAVVHALQIAPGYIGWRADW
jgi:hypothetical protein